MATKSDIFLAIATNNKSNIRDINKKIPSIKHFTIYKYIKQLKEDNLIKNIKNTYIINNTKKSKELFSLIYFCFKNNLDYNIIVSKNIAKYIYSGYKNEYLDNSLFNNRTIKKYNTYLSKAGIIYIQSKKPLKTRLIPSNFTDLLVKYFLNKKTSIKFNYKSIDVDNKIEKEFSKFKRKQKIILSDEIKFVYTNLSLEGITLTLPQTEKLIKEDISPAIPLYKDIQQTTDYKKAINYLLKNEINLDSILEFHKIAMNSLDHGAGKIRKQNVKIKNNPSFKTPNWKELPDLLNKFSKLLHNTLNSKQKPPKIVESAAYIHNEFQRIHPFIDGNSRTSRAIFSILLVKFGFPLINIPVGYFDVYMKQTKMSKVRNDLEFTNLMKLVVLKNLEDRNNGI